MRCMPCACNCATLTSSHEKRLNASLNKPGVAALVGDSADVRLKAPTCSTVAWDLVHPYRGLILLGCHGMSHITAGSNMGAHTCRDKGMMCCRSLCSIAAEGGTFRLAAAAGWLACLLRLGMHCSQEDMV